MLGKMITFEGVEGCGKTTQIRIIHKWLSSRQSRVRMTREPGGMKVSQYIRDLLLHEKLDGYLSDRSEMFLYAADRAQHIESFIKPELEKGVIVLCDRFTDSTLAYQGYGRGLDLGEIHQVNQIATGGIVPDLTFWLDIPVEEGRNRISHRRRYDRIEKADLEFHRRVAEGYKAIACDYPQRIIRIDGGGDRNEITQKIQSILSQKLLEWN